jgi:endonuclease YncB( thermonuclease family)
VINLKKNKLTFLTLILLFVLVGCSKDDTSKEETKDFEIVVETPIANSIELNFTIGNDIFTDNSQEVTLVKCIDGDTAEFRLSSSKTQTVRFQGIDTPETHHPSKGIEPWGKAASQYTCRELENATQIVLEGEQSTSLYDQYDRMLAYVWVDGTLINAKLLEIGLAASGVNTSYKYYEDLYAAYFAGYGFVDENQDPNWDYDKYKTGECSQFSCVIESDYEYNFVYPEENN